MDHVIASLEKKQRQVVPEWYQAPLLQGELLLFLDVHGTAEIGDYQKINLYQGIGIGVQEKGAVRCRNEHFLFWKNLGFLL